VSEAPTVPPLADAAPGASTLTPRDRKLRQAAFFYLHVGLLYEVSVLVMARQGLLPPERGPVAVWLALGALIVAAVFWGLWWKRSVWLARVLWAAQAFRLPALVGGAFFPEVGARIPSGFYLTALVVVVANLWMLARAGWDV